MRKTITISLCVVMIGCASYRPIVDTQGVDMTRYESDLGQCQAFADQISPAGRAGAGAAIGAGLLAITGAIIGNRDTVKQGAALGALFGAAQGAGHGAEAQVDVIRRCMAGRGYRVLQ